MSQRKTARQPDPPLLRFAAEVACPTDLRIIVSTYSIGHMQRGHYAPPDDHWGTLTFPMQHTTIALLQQVSERRQLSIAETLQQLVREAAGQS